MEASTSSEKQEKLEVAKGRMLKGKRAKLYIIRRCIVMLLCWKENGDYVGLRQPASRGCISKREALHGDLLKIVQRRLDVKDAFSPSIDLP